ncbi:MAG: peptidoglycan editing factor PgeF [Mariprofundus sp.]
MADCDIIRSALLAEHGIDGFFTTRTGGVSPAPFDTFNFGPDIDAAAHINENISRLMLHTKLSSPPHQAVQVHTCRHIWCHGPGTMHTDQADIILTRRPATAVAVRTADCLPILLADPAQGIVAAVHAGWRGTAATVAARAVHEMLNHGARAENIIASLGPCIGPCCFQIGSDAATALALSVSGAEHCIQAEPLRADLAGINRLQLINSGLYPAHIESKPLCTTCDPATFFSYRRDGHRSGRHLAVVAAPSAT